MRRCPLVLAICAVLLGALAILSLDAAAGGAATAAKKKKASPPKACQLLKKSEIAAALAEPVKKMQGGTISSTGGSFCNWYGNDSQTVSKGVSLIVHTRLAKQQFKSYQRLFGHTTPVASVGDAAAAKGDSLIARKGRAFVFISPLYNHSGVTLDMLKPLAVKALNRAG